MEDPFNEKRFSVCMFLPVEIITVPERIATTNVESLTSIPSESQVRQAISKLYKKQEEFPDKVTYAKFPFGTLDFDGLKQLQLYHEYIQYKNRTAEEKGWLKQSDQTCRTLNIDLDKLYTYFQQYVWSTDRNSRYIRNFVGERWLTDCEIDQVFQIINKTYENTIAFVSKPTRFMYSCSGLRKKIQNVQGKGTKVSKIILALNVGCNSDGTCYVSDDKQKGLHWALLAIDVTKCTAYYGDSLGWPLPTNIMSTVGSNIKQIEEDLGIDIASSLNNITVIRNSADGSQSDLHTQFYPVQSCSNVCGIIVVCMAGLLCDQWESWLAWDCQTYVPLLSNPTVNSRQLRLTAMSWIIENKINTNNLLPHNPAEQYASMNASEKKKFSVI